jgi:ketosteroid isomerase-like protein
VYKATVRRMIRRNIARLNAGDIEPTLRMFADDAVLHFPADNSWSTQFRPVTLGREAFATHRGRPEIEAFLRRYVSTGMQMVVDDILVNGPPWRARAAARVHHWLPGPDGVDAYNNRAILFVETRWGRVHDQEDYEDTVRVAAYDTIFASEA